MGNWTTGTFLPITFERNLVESPDWRYSTRHESGIPKMTFALRLELTLLVYTHFYELRFVGLMDNIIDVKHKKHNLAKKKKKKKVIRENDRDQRSLSYKLSLGIDHWQC